jgi:hypothetical protein
VPSQSNVATPGFRLNTDSTKATDFGSFAGIPG